MKLRACEYTTLVSAIACSIAERFPEEQLPLIAAMLTQIGDTLTTMLAFQDACPKSLTEEGVCKKDADN